MTPEPADGNDPVLLRSARIAALAQKKKDEQEGADLVEAAAAAEKLEMEKAEAAAKESVQVPEVEIEDTLAPDEVSTDTDERSTELALMRQLIRDPDTMKMKLALDKWVVEVAARKEFKQREALAEVRGQETLLRAVRPNAPKAVRKLRATPTLKRGPKKALVADQFDTVPMDNEGLRKAGAERYRGADEFSKFLEGCRAGELATGLKKVGIQSSEDVACFTPLQLQQALAGVGCNAGLHHCTYAVKAAKSAPPASLDGTAGSRFVSTDINELMGALGDEEAEEEAEKPRAELWGLPLAQALFERAEQSTTAITLVRQGIEILGCKTSADDELAAELFENALAQLGFEPEQMRTSVSGARAARSHLLALQGGLKPALDVENKTSSSGSEEPEKETSSMMDMLGHALGKTPADGKAAMHEEMAHTRLARVAADGGARQALSRMVSDDVLRSEERLASQLTTAMSAHASLNELLHQSNLSKPPSGAIKVGAVLVSVSDIRNVAAMAQKVQAMAFKALASKIVTMCPPSLVASGGVPAMLESVWFQQLGGSAGTSAFKLQTLIKDGTVVPSLQGKKLSPEASTRMLLSGMPCLAAAQGVSNPGDTTAQQVAARLTSLAGHNPQRVQYGTQLIIAPFLVRLERMQQTFEQGCGELPTFQAAWDEVRATPLVKKYIESYEEADIAGLAGDETSAAVQQRLETMEKQLKSALELAAKAQNAVSNLKQLRQGDKPPGGQPALAQKPAVTKVKNLSQEEWDALTKEEKWALKEARIKAKKEKDAGEDSEKGEE